MKQSENHEEEDGIYKEQKINSQPKGISFPEE